VFKRFAAHAAKPFQCPADDVADRVRAVERRIRVLEDDLHRLDLFAGALFKNRGQWLGVQRDRSGLIRRHQAQQQAGKCRLARAGFADQPERLAGLDCQRHIGHRAQRVAMPG
jgi:hypothetical protein